MKALIAMSGGVDSSVAAYLMKKQGYDCIGCTMKLFDAEDTDIVDTKTCCSIDDVEDARSVAHRLDMPYYVFNYKDEFRKKVIDNFVESYIRGITPNPCIECNRYLKFDKLIVRAKELGCDCVVTGHYARITFDGSSYHLLKGLDESKDQSYVLYSLSQQQLSMIRLPIGELSKTQVRAIASEQGFINAEKPDSQDICFVPNGDYASVIEKRTGKRSEPGNFTDKDGNILGRHSGIIHYTTGQRKGLGIGFGKPMYVLKTDPASNTVVLGSNEDLFTTDVKVRDVNWTGGSSPFIENNGSFGFAYVAENKCKVQPPGTFETIDDRKTKDLPCPAGIIKDHTPKDLQCSDGTTDYLILKYLQCTDGTGNDLAPKYLQSTDDQLQKQLQVSNNIADAQKLNDLQCADGTADDLALKNPLCSAGTTEDQTLIYPAFYACTTDNRKTKQLPCTAKIRYRQQAAPAVIIPQENGNILLRFDKPQRAPTPGQAAVFYIGEELIGGGVIY